MRDVVFSARRDPVVINLARIDKQLSERPQNRPIPPFNSPNGFRTSVAENLAPEETSVAAIRPVPVILSDIVGVILEDHVVSDPDFRLTLHGDDHLSHRNHDTHHPTISSSTLPPSPTAILLCKRLKAPLMTNCQMPC